MDSDRKMSCLIFSASSHDTMTNSSHDATPLQKATAFNQMLGGSATLTFSQAMKRILHTSRSHSSQDERNAAPLVSNQDVTIIDKAIMIPVPNDKSDDSFLMNQFSTFHQIFSSHEECPSFCLIISDKLDRVGLGVKFQRSDEVSIAPLFLT